MGKELLVGELYAVYGKLLTEHQSKLTEMYYIMDLSLGEISELEGLTRQAVNDVLKKSRELMQNYESKLHVLANNARLRALIEKMPDTEEGRNAIKELTDILEND